MPDSHEMLLDALSDIDPVELEALPLYHRLQTGEEDTFPDIDTADPDEDIQPAYEELLELRDASLQLARKLDNIPPIPVDSPVQGFGL